MEAWQATVQDEAGNTVFNPQITVYESDGVTLASIFNEDGTPKANPFTGSLEGFAQFWAGPGVYKIRGANGGQTELWDWSVVSGKIFILATGQSNMFRERPYGAYVSDRVFRWNNVQGDMTSVGNSFEKISPGNWSTSISFANELAERNPGSYVYIVNCALGGRGIEGWLPGSSPEEDVYSNCVANMGPAISAAGVDSIDYMLWWQGENGATDIDYPNNFEEVITRFRSNVWFPYSTPIAVFGVSPTTRSGRNGDDGRNLVLQGVASSDGAFRKYINIPALASNSLWQDGLHLNGEGYFHAGRMAASSILGSSGFVPYRIGSQLSFIRDLDGYNIGTGEFRFNTSASGVPFPMTAIVKNTQYDQNFQVQEIVRPNTGARLKRHRRSGTLTPWRSVNGLVYANKSGSEVQNIPPTGFRVVSFTNSVHDPFGTMNSSVFTPPVGFWDVSVSIYVDSGISDGERIIVKITNESGSSTYISSEFIAPASGSGQVQLRGIINSDGSNGYIVTAEGSGSIAKPISINADKTYFSAICIDAGI